MNKLLRHTIHGLRIMPALVFSILSHLAAAQVSISPGTWITVKEGGSLYIGTDLHIKSTADSSGYFVDQTIDGDVTITGDITVDRYMAPDIWHNVASPVSNETSACFTGTDLVYWYDETQIWNDWNFGWVWYTGATGGPLTVFRGYDVFFPDNPVTVNYSATGAETLNTGNYIYNVTVTDPTPNPIEIPSHVGWNLAGNPYPSPVDWLAASGWDKSDINDAKYIWDGDNDIYTIFIGGGSPIGINGGTRYIPSNQGFWVQAVQNGTLGISNAVRLGNMTGTPDFYKNETPGYPLISLIAESNGRSDEAVVRFIEGTTAGFDKNFDASKLFSPSDEVPQLSIRAGKQSLALNTFPNPFLSNPIELDFQCGEKGIFTIRLGERTWIPDTLKVYLKDELENRMTLLNSDAPYNYFHHPNNSRDRFKLYINPPAAITENLPGVSNFIVYSSGNRVTIIKNTSLVLSGEIDIINLLGQVVEKAHYNNEETRNLTLNLPGGEYFIMIKTKSNIFRSNFFINNK
ncbi:MAG TPA: T9SS type A sorting domain-containing protein [Bacteroidales bacterium]|nr:T9SS type A sorting domain-containing protein [Bacteroidales bacterium]